MDNVRQYLISIIAAAMFSSIATLIAEKNGTLSTSIKLITGLFLTLTIIAPLINVRVGDITTYFSDVESQAESLALHGEDIAIAETKDIIKNNLEAYILDKASALGLDIQAEIFMSEGDLYAPLFVTLKGAVSPYAKRRLEQIISDDLDIPKENQTWT